MALGDLLFPNIEMKLVIAHAFDADVESVKDKYSDDFKSVAAKARMSKKDMQKIGLKESSRLKIESKVGKVIVQPELDPNGKEGLVVMPRSPWSFALVAVPDDGSPPVYHGISVTVERSSDDITPLQDLLQSR